MKLLFISLGCDKNLVDSEEMLGLLSREKFEFTDDEAQADVIIINTCCFIHDAKEESINTILEMAEYRKEGNCKALLVTGCLAQRYQEEIRKEIPEVDAVLGTSAYDEIALAVRQVLEGNTLENYQSLERLIVEEENRIITTGGHYAYLKIAEGCDKRCTYCIIPKIRGGYRSVPMEELVLSARRLADKGVKELILVAQETTVYGKDIYGEKKLPELLKRLCEISGIVWIRLLYCYPEEITEELINTMKSEKKVCNYIDMPIQHASDRILKAMGRRTSQKQLVETIGKLRQAMPDIAIRTTLITGFPGENEEDFEELMEFTDAMEFERLGVFTYSAEEDTVAAEMEHQVEEDVKQMRKDAVMELQQEISMEQCEALIGSEVLVMIEGRLVDENVYIGRTYRDAPGVDGNIFVNTDVELITGDFVNVRVTGALEYDLIGELV